MNAFLKKVVSLFPVILIFQVGCTDQTVPEGRFEGRWYTKSDMTSGREVFIKNCSKCHKREGQSVPDWKKKRPDGSYPAPPLNGSAHAWHHSKEKLLETINKGGISFGGKMPPFKEKLTDEEKLSTIAYFQSFWTDKIYSEWTKRK